MRRLVVVVALALVAAGCTSTKSSEQADSEGAAPPESTEPSEAGEGAQTDGTGETPVDPDVGEGLEAATFAGGCFWCMEKPFEKLEGVQSVVSGYAGGLEKNPGYRQVASGKTDHTETVRIVYDPEVVRYEKLLEVYWRSMDPTDSDGQFADQGSQYRPVIFYHDERQKKLAETSKRQLEKEGPFDEPIVVPIEPATRFWKAEQYHQDYYKKNPERYDQYYRKSGRAGFLERVWEEETK